MPSPCLKQDLQDAQDGQDGGRLGRRDKGLEDLNVYSISRKQEDKVREDLNRPRARFCCLKQDGQDAQDLQDGAARADGPKVWKTFMSIDISRNKMTRSERTLIGPVRVFVV